MVVDGKRLSEGERLKLLAGIEEEGKRAPVQLELPLERPPLQQDDDVRYQWKDEQEPALPGRGCVVAIGISLLFWVAIVFAITALAA